MVTGIPENREYFCQYINLLDAHTFNIIVNPTDIGNIIERVRPAYGSLTYPEMRNNVDIKSSLY